VPFLLASAVVALVAADSLRPNAMAAARGGARAVVLTYRGALHRDLGQRALADADLAAAAAAR
jgi:hypothetical protein